MRRCERCGITEETHDMVTRDGEVICYECDETDQREETRP